MFSLLGDIKLWSFECDINIQDTDFGTFRYHEKRSDNIYNVSKRAYSEERGMLHTLHNRKGNKLKEKIKYLEEQLRSNSIVYCRWFNQYVVQLVFNTGLLCYIQVNLFTGDIDKLTFDRFLVGKVPDTISDAAITSNHIICVQNDNQIIIVHFAKPKSQIFDKISKLDPKLLTLDLPSPSSRRSEKKIRVNRSGDLILIWWKSTINEVYPWSPAMKEHDHANVHLYRLLGSKFELLCYLRTEFDPLCIKFNTQQDNSIHSIEQKVSRKGEVTIEWQIYGISPQDKLQRIEVISIPLPTHTTCAKFSPNQDMLLLCCIDGSIIIHDHIKRTNNVLKAGFIPTLASWHNHGLIFTIGNDRGQAQHYDISSSCIKSQLLNEDAMPTNTLDLSSYFRNQPNLIKMAWNKKKGDINLCNGRLNDRDALLLILFERGPIGVMRIVEGNNLSGDTLVFRYLNLQLPDRATSLLLSMNWDLQPRTCMYALSQIVNYLFKLPLCPEHENLIQNALSSFYVPVQSISQTVEDEYSNEVRDLTRKFFYHLIRHRLFEKAFRLAIDLNDHDLFMDIHFYAVAINDVKMATMSEERAQLILNRSDSCSSSHSFCSRPSCSLCSHSGSDNRSQSCSEESDNENSFHRRLKYKFNQNGLNHKQLGSVTDQTPPLPVFNPPGIPKLRISSFGNPTNYTLSTIPTKLSSESSPFMNISKDFISSSFDNMPMNKLSMHERASNKIENEKSFHEESRNTPKHSEVTYTLSEGINSLDPSMSMKYSLTNIDINGRNITSDKHSTNNDPLRLIVHDSRHSELRYDPTCNNAVTNTDMESRLLSTSFNDVMCKTSFNNDDHLMSTSFNDEGSSESLEIHTTHQKTSFFNQFESDFEETFESNAYCDTTIEVPPPPPAMTSSLANYLNSLPKKKSPLSASTSGSNNRIDKAMTTFPGTHSMKHSSSQILQTQSSVSKILQNQCINNCSIMRTCKFNYDLDCIQYSCGCENDNVDRSLDGKQSVYSDALKHFQNNYNQQCKPVDSVLVKPNIFQSNKGSSGVADSIITSNVPPLPVINGTNSKPSSKYQGSTDGLTNFNEKPKVKFSNTVTHILVPEMDQPYQPIQKQKIIQLQMMNSEREVTDNLLSRDSRKNDDFLKDVHSIAKMEKPNETRRTEESSTIKVVHFGHL